MKRIDRTGEKYGRLTVIEHVPNAPGAKDTNARWLCMCECGKAKIVYGQDLKKGKVVSCGCWNEEKRTKHGMARTRIYKVWMGIRVRCTNPKERSYPNYGGRGIQICERWLTFENFLADMGDRPAGYEIDRIDNNGNYEPSNCRWVSRKVNLNNKRDNRVIEFNGESKTMAQWAEQCGIRWDTLRSRIDRYGWSIERALTTPTLISKEQ